MAATNDDVTEDELAVVSALRGLQFKPGKIESPDDLEKFMHKYPDTSKDSSEVKRDVTKQFPKISIFFGETGKGEVSYLTWRYEVQCLMEQGQYSEEVILLSLRRSVKGEAANILRRMGVRARLADILRKFKSTFGEVDTKESILKKFYACSQGEAESVVKYAARVEEVFAEAVEMEALKVSDEPLLKNIFFQGLRQSLRNTATYKFETTKDYDIFKVEVRKLEDSMKTEKIPCQAASNVSELGEVKCLLEKLNNRIEKLEQQQHGQFQQSPPVPRWPRMPSQGGGQFARGNSGRGQFLQGTYGRGQYRPQRPTGSNTMRPQIAGYFGNLQPDLNETRTCYKCSRQGHIAVHCPLN